MNLVLAPAIPWANRRCRGLLGKAWNDWGRV
jgi:hypothetical protein